MEALSRFAKNLNLREVHAQRLGRHGHGDHAHHRYKVCGGAADHKKMPQRMMVKGVRPRARPFEGVHQRGERDRKSTRLNSSHVATSYAVLCRKRKTSGGR